MWPLNPKLISFSLDRVGMVMAMLISWRFFKTLPTQHPWPFCLGQEWKLGSGYSLILIFSCVSWLMKASIPSCLVASFWPGTIAELHLVHWCLEERGFGPSPTEPSNPSSQLQFNFSVPIVLVAQSCLTLCDPMDCTSVHGILQARILEWVVITFAQGPSWPRNRTRVSWVAGRFFTIWATREALISLQC